MSRQHPGYCFHFGNWHLTITHVNHLNVISWDAPPVISCCLGLLLFQLRYLPSLNTSPNWRLPKEEGKSKQVSFLLWGKQFITKWSHCNQRYLQLSFKFVRWPLQGIIFRFFVSSTAFWGILSKFLPNRNPTIKRNRFWSWSKTYSHHSIFKSW